MTIRDLWRSYLSIRRGQFDHIRNDRRISQTICVLEALFVATVVITNAVLFSELVARAEMEKNWSRASIASRRGDTLVVRGAIRSEMADRIEKEITHGKSD